MDWQPWQTRFRRAVEAPENRTSVLSLGRGNGKSTLIADLAKRILTPSEIPSFCDIDPMGRTSFAGPARAHERVGKVSALWVSI